MHHKSGSHCVMLLTFRADSKSCLVLCYDHILVLVNHAHLTTDALCSKEGVFRFTCVLSATHNYLYVFHAHGPTPTQPPPLPIPLTHTIPGVGDPPSDSCPL